ncbi:hypothetical protein BC826DRAFT_1030873, partial [Russula brevipes]
GIEVSLLALKEASALTAKIPCISVVAGLLLQALTMRDASEVKQYKEEWELVMEKVEKVAGLVTYIGTSCKTYKLKEKDISPGLRTTFRSLETELDGIRRALIQNTQVGGIKTMFLRKELLSKVKQCDARLSTVLQTFQAALAVDSCALVSNDDSELTSGLSGLVSLKHDPDQIARSLRIFVFLHMRLFRARITLLAGLNIATHG